MPIVVVSLLSCWCYAFIPTSYSFLLFTCTKTSSSKWQCGSCQKLTLFWHGQGINFILKGIFLLHVVWFGETIFYLWLVFFYQSVHSFVVALTLWLGSGLTKHGSNPFFIVQWAQSVEKKSSLSVECDCDPGECAMSCSVATAVANVFQKIAFLGS
jgi:hypothetical protein